MTQKSPFELLLTASGIQHRVPRRTLSPHTAHERGTFAGSFHFANSTAFTMVSLRVRWLPLYRFPTLSLRALPKPAGSPPLTRLQNGPTEGKLRCNPVGCWREVHIAVFPFRTGTYARKCPL